MDQQNEKSDADIMAESREYIEENGWWKGALVGPNGRQVCGLGAVLRSQGWLVGWSENRITSGHRDRALGIVQKVYNAVHTEITECFTAWNDHPLTQKQMVLDAFAKAEKIERTGFDPDQGIEL